MKPGSFNELLDRFDKYIAIEDSMLLFKISRQTTSPKEDK